METSPRTKRRHGVLYVLAIAAVLLVGYFVFFRVEEAETPTVDANPAATVEQPAAN